MKEIISKAKFTISFASSSAGRIARELWWSKEEFSFSQYHSPTVHAHISPGECIVGFVGDHSSGT
jgi:hypothetical protein